MCPELHHYLKSFDISNHYRQNLSIWIGWTETSRDHYETSQNVLSAAKLRVYTNDRMNATLLLRASKCVPTFARSLSCWTAAITKKHRLIYEHTYSTMLVQTDGSTITIEYPVPRKIIILPIDATTLSEQEKKLRLERLKPKTKIVVKEEIIDDDFDAFKYIKKNT